MATFNVLSSNPSNEGKSFVWKMQVVTEETVFGIKKSVKRTYYIGGMPVSATVGTELKEDINKFTIKQYPFVHPETGEELMLSWLHAKQS